MAKLSASKARSRARKAAITRCQNKCSATGGRLLKRCSKKTSSARRRRVSRARKSPWLAHVKAWRDAHPNATYAEALQKAASSYRKVSKRRSSRRRSSRRRSSSRRR